MCCDRTGEGLDSSQIVLQNSLKVVSIKRPISSTTTAEKLPPQGPAFRDPTISDRLRMQSRKVVRVVIVVWPWMSTQRGREGTWGR